jgi:hypothetical protein
MPGCSRAKCGWGACVLEVVRAPTNGGHWNLSWRMALLCEKGTNPSAQKEISRTGARVNQQVRRNTTKSGSTSTLPRLLQHIQEGRVPPFQGSCCGDTGARLPSTQPPGLCSWPSPTCRLSADQAFPSPLYSNPSPGDCPRLEFIDYTTSLTTY